MTVVSALRLLLIEDSELDAELTLDVLAQAGYAVAHRRVDTRAGLLDALTVTWDVIVSDYSMPGFDGTEALSLILERGVDTPFVFVSGVIGEVLAVEAMRAGARDYVPKDQLARLGPAVRRELAEADNRRARAASEAALRHEQGRYRDIFETAGIALVELDLTDVMARLDRAAAEPGGVAGALAAPATLRSVLAGLAVRAANDEAARLVEVATRGEVAAAFPAVLASVADAPLRAILCQLASGAQAIEHEVAFDTHLGRRRHALLSLRPARHDGARRTSVLSAVDITERRRLEQQVNAAHRMESLGRLAGGVAHDFNNLLTVIGSYARFVRDELPPGRARDDLDVALDASGRAAELAGQLLAFSKTEPQRAVAFSPNDAIAATHRLLARLIGEHIEVRTDLSPDVPTLRMDRGQFDQILLNLVVNARDAMPDGGRISIETDAAPRVDVDGTPTRYAVLRVRDSGHGMSEAVRARIFEPFFTTKESGKGTGLGLATVYGIVRGHGGTIDVVSAPGAGAVFTVALPPAPAVPASSEVGPAAVVAAPVARGRVLVVDDDAFIRHATGRILERAGYQVVAAASAAEALQVAGDVELVISDQMMPGGTGVALRAAARARWPRAAFLLTSGFPSDAVAQAAKAGAPVECLAKPFTREELLAKTSEVLARQAGGG